MGKVDPLYTAEGWFQALRAPEFIAYLTVSRPPSQCSRSQRHAAREALWATPLIRHLVATQRPAGDWPSHAPGGSERLRFRQFPIPLTVLCDAGFTLDDEPVRRAGRYLLSTLEGGVFRNPWREADEPLACDEAHIGHCLEALAKSGLAGHAPVQQAVRLALEQQRWDGGWSVHPAVSHGEGSPGPIPSCPHCTAAMIRGLGCVARLPEAAVERVMAYRLDEQAGAAAADALPELLLQLEFLARQGRRKGDPHVQRLLQRLESALGADGRFLLHRSARDYCPPEYTQSQYNHLRWWLGGDWPT